MRDHPYAWACGDEAGETGFRFERGSTTHFLYCLLLADDLQPLRDYVSRVRRELKMPSLKEFSFNHSSDAHRRQFIAGLSECEFVVRVLTVNKVVLPRHFAKMGKLSFYAFCLGGLIERIPPGELGQTTLVLDRFSGDQTTIRLIQKRLRATGQSGLVKKIKMVRSESDRAIQAADMVAGAILRGVTAGDHSFYAPIRDRLISWEYSADKNPPS
jgi:hypothetical protein